MKRRVIITILAFALCFSIVPFTAYASQPSSWAVSEVNEAIALGIVPGALQSQYSTAITRAEFCELMVQLLTVKQGEDIDAILRDNNKTMTNTFSDTKDRNVLAACALGIVNGTGNGAFSPSRGITRQEAATMLARAAALIGSIPPVAGPLSYTDQDRIASWALEGVYNASLALVDRTNNRAVMGGTGSNQFSPLGTYSREQAIITAKRLFNAFISDAPTVSLNAFIFPYKFTAQDLYGNAVTEESLGEKEVFFVHYWGTWCPPCLAEMPELGKVVQKYGDRVGFIGLLDDYSTNRAGAVRIKEETGADFINVDATHKDLRAVLKLVESGYVPTSVLIGKDGKIIGEQIIGAHGSGYADFIEAALGN